MDIANNIDTLFIIDIGSYIYPYGCYGTSYIDYEFFSNDPTQFIFVGSDYDVDAWVAILRNDERVYILYLLANEQQLLKSVDGGYNWTIEYDSLAWIDYAMISLSHFDDNQIYGVDDSKLVRSEDEGYNYIIVDDSEWKPSAELFYDVDGQHIYGVYTYKDYFMQEYLSKIYVSNNHGNPFTWTNLFTYNIPIRFTLDEYQSGEVYYSIQKNIFKSTNFGSSFQHYIRLDENISGLYKKSGTNILYASTPLNIYKITPDSIHTIKSLPIPNAVLNFYPLAVGNKWVYNESTIIHDPYPHGWDRIVVREVIGDTIAPNGKHYYHIIDETLWESSVLERVDSFEGKVYRYYEDSTLSENEYLVDDLLAEVGDTVYSSRMGFNMVAYTTMFAEDTFEKWGLTKSKKVFQQYTLHPPVYSLTQDIGLDSIHSFFDFFGDTWTVLKGCIINGTVYGDTTLVSVEDKEPNLPAEFSLSQNYPNPFNPSTKIKYSIPSNVKRGTSKVTLKIYDVLGNEIATLVNEEKPAGSYEAKFDASTLPSGIYFYRLQAGSFVETKKMVLMK
jgi:hypothetical protein